MGGHGGLNILPQKKWNVYNFDNRERVRRDEEAAAREEQLKRQKARREDLEFKLERLREAADSKRRRLDQGSEGAIALEAGESSGAIVPREDTSGAIVLKETPKEPQHINFFAEYEAKEREEETQNRGKGRKAEQGESRERDLSLKERNARRGGIEQMDGKPTGEPVNEKFGLAHGLVDKNGKKPWYTYKIFMKDRTTDGELQRPETKSRGESKRPDKKLRITDGSDSKKDKSKQKKIEELRKERLEREQREKAKVQRLVAAQSDKSSAGYNRLTNGRVPQYHASYGNARQSN